MSLGRPYRPAADSVATETALGPPGGRRKSCACRPGGEGEIHAQAQAPGATHCEPPPKLPPRQNDVPYLFRQAVQSSPVCVRANTATDLVQVFRRLPDSNQAVHFQPLFFAGIWQTKFGASSMPPLPLYWATCGWGDKGNGIELVKWGKRESTEQTE